MNIEDELVPQTVNEQLLMLRIQELKRARLCGAWRPWDPPSEQQIDVDTPAPLELRLAASVTASPSDFARFRVSARSSSGSPEGCLGYHYYVPRQEWEQIKPLTAAQMLSELHTKLVRDLARYVSTNGPR